MSNHVTTIKNGRVVEVVLNRPPVNAIDLKTSCELFEAFKAIQDDPEVRVGLFHTGGERIFSAGWDLKEYAETGDQLVESGEYDLGPGGLGGLPEFWGLNKPIIAAVNGHAIGGGFEMLLAADLIVASDTTQFWLPEIQLGFLPDGGGIQRLPKRLPWHLANELMLTGRRFSAQEAQRHGLVCEVLPAAELLGRARELAAQIAEGAPLAMQAMKEVMVATEALSVEQSFALTRRNWKDGTELPIYKKMLNSEDYLEGSCAFSEKRQPVYKGC